MAESEDRSDTLSVDQTIASTPHNGHESVSEVDSALANQGTVRAEADQDHMIGQIIAERYEIDSLLGQGGMASVYSAKHVVLNKRVAVKILHQSTGLDQETITRFQQEASGLAVLQHPNLVAISDFGLAQSGHPYCVMDLVEGKSLADLISEGDKPQYKRLSQLFSDVCAALEYAHTKNIIHRDLKPSNIIVSVTADGKWLPKLIDFGIAKFGDLNNQVMTRTGVIFGSPLYMSPEQCEGNKLDQRSDIYSLGCTMYEAIAGRPPFVGRTALQTLSMHSQNEPVPPHAVRSDVPVDLERIVLKCLAKSPETRYQSALEVQRDLNKVDMRSAIRRAQDRWIANAIAALLLIGLLVGLLWRLNSLNNLDESKIAKITDAGFIRDCIAAKRNDRAFSKHLLAALYCRLLDLDGPGGKNTLKDTLEAYKWLIVPDLKDVSFYTWYIASATGYARFMEWDYVNAASCEQVALDIYDKIPVDVRMMTPSLLNDINVIVAEAVSRPAADQKNLHAQIDRARKIWRQIEDNAPKTNMPFFRKPCADIFIELAQRCQKGGDVEDAINCFKQAAVIYGEIPDIANRDSTEKIYNGLLKSRQDPLPLVVAVGPSEQEAKAENQSYVSEAVRLKIDEASKKANAASDPGQKVECARKYYNLCRRYMPDSGEAFHATSYLAFANKNANNLPAALAAGREAMALNEKLKLPASQDSLYTAQLCLAGCLADRDMAGAKRYEKLYFQFNDSLFPDNTAKLARADMDIGYTWYMAGAVREARLCYMEAKKVMESNKLTLSADYRGTLEMLSMIKQ